MSPLAGRRRRSSEVGDVGVNGDSAQLTAVVGERLVVAAAVKIGGGGGVEDAISPVLLLVKV